MVERNDKGQFVKGGVSWFKGKKRLNYKHSGQFKKGMTSWLKGKKNPLLAKRNKSLKQRECVSKALLGRKFTEEHKRKLSQSMKGRKSWNKNTTYLSPKTSGKNHWNWKGGISSEIQLRLNVPEWNIIRKRILKRDRYVCQFCGVSKKLDVHHKIPWRNINSDCDENLIALCRSCHMREERLLTVDKCLAVELLLNKGQG